MNIFKQLYEKIAFNKQFLKAARFLEFAKLAPVEFKLKPTDKCLILAPHPDDETIGCGGLLIDYYDQCDVICLTDGKGGGFVSSSNEVISERKDEFKKVMKELRIKNYSLLNIPDRKLIKNYDKFSEIDLSDYNYVFIPNHTDQHKDHKAVSVLLKKKLKESNKKVDFKIAFYEVWSPLSVVNYFIDLTETIPRKQELIDFYESQTEFVDFSEGMSCLNRYRGLFGCNKDYAEAYCIVDVKTFLSLQTIDETNCKNL